MFISPNDSGINHLPRLLADRLKPTHQLLIYVTGERNLTE
jgi:hypothetical protein